MPLLSFIIPAYNEEALLGPTLDAVRRAFESLGERGEIIVVDDASTDATAAVAAARGARVVSVSCRQIAATRNAGAAAASGDILFFIDADTLVDAAVLSAALAAIRSGAVGGGCAVRFSGPMPLYGRLMAEIGAPLYRLAGLAAGCFLFCTREAFIVAGGFDEKLFAAEEVALSRSLRARGRFVVLRESVMTSGRKLRTHSGTEVLAMMLRIIGNGPRALRDRRGLEIWYGERRVDRDNTDQ